MAMVELLQKSIDYMEEHLLEPITIEDIAKQAHVSPYHFQRTFMILTNVSVGEYLRRRRLTLAAHQLSSTDCKIIDLAYRYGYDTPESFSKAFRKQHGVTPNEARKGIGKLQSYNRLSIQVNLKGVEPMKYHIVERDAFQVVGLKKEFSCEESMGEGIPGIQELWGEVHQKGIVNQLLELNNGQISGLLGMTVDNSEQMNELVYWVATEYSGNVPVGLFSLEVPASKWVNFEVRGQVPEAIVQTWKQIMSEWFPSNSYEHAHAGTPSFEVYKDPDPTSPDSYAEIWVPIK